MPTLAYNYAQEARRVNSSNVRPYPLDYFIASRNDPYEGRRDAWFKVQNAILHTILKKREERKAMTLFDRVYQAVTKEKAKEREDTTFDKIKLADTYNPTRRISFCSSGHKTSSSNVVSSFQGKRQ